MKFTFKQRKKAPIEELIPGDAEMVRVGNKWMRVVSTRRGEKVTAIIRPVEYFSGGPDQEFQSVAQDHSLKTEDGRARFIQVAITHIGSTLPVSWRYTNKFIDRNVAIADFDIYLCAAGYQYHGAFIAFEAWNIWFDDCRCVDFPIWRGVLEVTRRPKFFKRTKTIDGSIKVWTVDLESLEEIEEASKSLLSAPSPEILAHLGAPVRLVDV